MPETIRPLFEQIDSWIAKVDNTKTAAAKTKPAAKKAGVKKAGPSGMGESSHPSDDVDDNTHGSDTGARFEENASDVKKDVPGQAVDSTDPNSGGSQDDKQFNIGTKQAPTGEDPSVEEDYKGDKDDPGTSHPANADDTGEKYSSMQLKQLLKVAESKAHNILADLATGVANTQRVVQAVQAVKAATAPVQQPIVQMPADFPAHPASANPSLEKTAAEFIESTIHDAELDADLVGSFMHSYNQTRQKAAEDDGAQEGESDNEESPPSPEGGGGGGADILSALGGAGGGGGLPPEAAGGGLPPEAGAGDPGAGGAGGMTEDQALQELAMALQELGISPEELAQLVQGGAGGGGLGGGGGGPPGLGGGGPPGLGAGGPPPVEPPMPGPAEQGAKLASQVIRFKRAGKFRVEEAKTAQQRRTRDQIKEYIMELTSQ